MNNVCILGSVNLDVVTQVVKLPRAGETVGGFGSAEIPGGKGANQAVAAARMGAEVRLIAALGCDGPGQDLKAFLSGADIDTQNLIELEGCSTGRAFIFVDADGENFIVVIGGANLQLRPEHLPTAGVVNNAVRLAQLETPLETLAARAGVAGAPIVVSDTSRRTHASTADMAGFGPTKRIVLSDNLLVDATTPEVLFLTARELGHYAHGDDFRLSLFWTALLLACTAIAVICADGVGFRRDDDPLSRLSLVFAFLGVLGLIATPLYNGYSRNLEGRADEYALSLTHDPSGAARSFVRIADETLSPLCASGPIVWYFYNSPPLGTRIAKATGEPDPCR